MTADLMPAKPIECVFCKRIDKHEYDYEDGFSVAFEPLNPVTPGHLLVVPLEHVSDALEYPLITGRVARFAARLANQLGITSCNLITSVGAEATQSVFHFHMHIVPRFVGDGLSLPWTNQKQE